MRHAMMWLAGLAVVAAITWAAVSRPARAQTITPPAAAPALVQPPVPVGRTCTVYLRGDGAGRVPVNALPHVEGRLLGLQDNWVVIEQDKAECWIPSTSVAMVEVERR